MTTTTTTHTAGGQCPGCGFVIAFATDATTAQCPECQTRVALTYVVGQHSEIPCDDRCQYAVKNFCSCSCGGRNHRAGYIKVEMVPAWVRKRDADRHAAKVARAEARVAKARAAKADQVAEQLAHPAIAALVSDDYFVLNLGSRFGSDMRLSLMNGKPLTPAQFESSVRIVEQARARKAQMDGWAAERAAKREAQLAAGLLCPSGRQTFEGKIVATRVADDQYYRGGLTWSALVESDAGWQIWVTMPREMLRQNPAMDYTTGRGDHDLAAHRASFRGRRVELTATITADATDPLRGRGSRPAGRLLDADLVAA